MSRLDAARLDDIIEAVTAIDDHLTKGSLSEGLIYDAVRVRLIEIVHTRGNPTGVLNGADRTDPLDHSLFDGAQGRGGGGSPSTRPRRTAGSFVNRPSTPASRSRAISPGSSTV